MKKKRGKNDNLDGRCAACDEEPCQRIMCNTMSVRGPAVK